MGRKISDVGDRGTPGYRRDWLGAIRLKRGDMDIDKVAQDMGDFHGYRV